MSDDSEVREFKCEDSEESLDASMAATEQLIKNGEYAKTTKFVKQMEKKRRRAIESIAAFCYEAGIPFNALCIESFHLMVEAIGKFGPGLRGPSVDELRDHLLKEQVSATTNRIRWLKDSLEFGGCSIILDTWVDDNGRRLMVLGGHSIIGLSFIRSIHLSSKASDDTYIFRLVDSCIEEIGEKNVVQVVSNIESNNMVAKMLTAKRPNIFWTQCAARCIDSMLEDIGNIALIKNTVVDARSITVFMYSHAHLLDMMRKFTNQKDLVQAGVTHSITTYLNLKSLYDKRIELKTMFVSRDWEDSKWSKEAVGEKFYNLVLSKKFWHRMLYAINSLEPIVDILRRSDSGILSMASIYGDLANAKREIALRFLNMEEHYLPIWNIIDKRCNASLKTPLHLAGRYLNPFYYFQNKNEIDNLGIYRAALVDCMHSMCKDPSTQNMILNQLELYKNCSITEGVDYSKFENIKNLDLDADFWWMLHRELGELKEMAVRILSLTCGSLACERSWIEMIHKKKPSRVTWKQFYDSAFVMVNKRLKRKGEETYSSDPVVPYLPDEDEPYEWLADMHENDHAVLDVHKDEIRAMLTVRNRSWEEGPNHAGDASCLKEGNEPWRDDQSILLEEEEHEGNDEDGLTNCSKRKRPSDVSCPKQENNSSRVVDYKSPKQEREGSDEEEQRHSSKESNSSAVPCCKEAKSSSRVAGYRLRNEEHEGSDEEERRHSSKKIRPSWEAIVFQRS
ncbi:uncharacterized protein LOC102715424 [Oryza brachyantha]|uniref:DUF659 domain-containing protein n=1 Tax=Oryza brachyantha TaxID=4533 RepID=J3N0M9_ORYBR|nr:uncharacterized protein LOC102715424 [Oryza brachyantha]